MGLWRRRTRKPSRRREKHVAEHQTNSPMLPSWSLHSLQTGECAFACVCACVSVQTNCFVLYDIKELLLRKSHKEGQAMEMYTELIILVFPEVFLIQAPILNTKSSDIR